jgi:enamine deaminase RidA (YjgF/YER057c/UK114 family)
VADTVDERLRRAGLELPEAPQALGAYVPATRAGALVFTAGQLPMRSGSLVTSGTVDDRVPAPVAKEAAAVAALNALAAASTVCDLDAVERVLRLSGFVASAPGFTEQPSVVDGASEVVLAAFGDSGRHARLAVGVPCLPKDAPVEIELVLAVSS